MATAGQNKLSAIHQIHTMEKILWLVLKKHSL